MKSTPESRAHATRHRQNMTGPELRLWSRLRNNQLGVRFRRQVARSDYVLDFYCHSAGLAIEVDGPSHDDRAQYDAARTKRLIKNFAVRKLIRFTNDDVIHNIEDVVTQIRAALLELARE